MRAYFEIKNGTMVPSTAEEGNICVFSAPDDREKQQIIESLDIDPYDLDSALDPDEISRVEFAPDRVFMIWKQPKTATMEQQAIRFEVSSVGFYRTPGMLTMIIGENVLPFSAKEFQGVVSPDDVLLRYLFHTIRHYLGHLKAIKQITVELQSKIGASMENRYLLQMFDVSESLIYYLNAIEANGAALSKLRGRGERIGLSEDQIDFLDDTILENNQCTRQARIFSTVLSGLMDARGTIVNNNMNVLLKNLTIINVVFLPLNLIASIGGMSEYSMMTHGMNWTISYFLFSMFMVLIGWLTWVALIRYIDKGTNRRVNGAAGVRSVPRAEDTKSGFYLRSWFSRTFGSLLRRKSGPVLFGKIPSSKKC
ncbi:MAG: magnesium transporter CorA family protein [Syntrophales bacterium]|nr:magnesium transporter CorA family protein [Syntrophales bacterium]